MPIFKARVSCLIELLNSKPYNQINMSNLLQVTNMTLKKMMDSVAKEREKLLRTSHSNSVEVKEPLTGEEQEALTRVMKTVMLL